MAEWLLLRLPRTADSLASWLITDANGLAGAPPAGGTLAEAAVAAARRRVCVLVGAGDVLITQVELPVKGGARAAQVVPYALEEQLVGDIEQQQFAVGPRDEFTGRTSVAVVGRGMLEQWLTELRTAGIEPEMMCAESSLLPSIPGSVVALLDNDLLTVLPASGGAQPVSVPAGDLAAAFDIALAGEDTATTHLLLHCSPHDWQRRSSQVEALRSRFASLKPQLLSSGVLPWLAPQLNSARAINLLQGDYAVRSRSGNDWRRWRLAAVLALALLGVYAAGKAYALVQIRKQEAAVDASLKQLSAQLLPGNTSVTGLRQRIQQRLTSSARPDQAGLLAVLQSLASAFLSNPGATLQALSYRDGNTELKLRAPDAQSLERINQALRAGGWTAELVGGSAAANAYEGRIQIKSGGRP